MDDHFLAIAGLILSALPLILPLLRPVIKWWGTRNAKVRKERDIRIAKLEQSKDEQTFASLESLHVLVFAVWKFITCLIILMFSLAFLLTMPMETRQGNTLFTLLIVAAIWYFIWSILDFLESIRRSAELYEARQYGDEADAVLTKPDGTRTEGIRGKKITEDVILINNTKLLIERGDKITLKFSPFQRTKIYEVLEKVLEVNDRKLSDSQLFKVRMLNTLNE